MSKRSFLTVVKNYEKLSRLGREIINHKEIVIALPVDRIPDEHRRQEERIEMFDKEAIKANRYWKENKITINEFWTGLS
jgi:hypothetical protein